MHLQGVPIVVVSAWLWRADLAFTMRTYVHSRPEDLAPVRDALAARRPPMEGVAVQ